MTKYNLTELFCMQVESEDIGKLTKIRIGHDGAGFGSAWFLEKVERLIERLDKIVSKSLKCFKT